MGNTITLNKNELNEIDEVYVAAGKVSPLFRVPAASINWISAKTLSMNKITVTGLSNYNRTGSGSTNVRGNVIVAKEERTLTRTRSAFYEMDPLDQMENPAFDSGAILATHMKNHVAPENDAYCVSKMFENAGTTNTTDVITEENILGLLDTAFANFDNSGVPEEGRILFVSSEVNIAIKNASGVERLYDVKTKQDISIGGIDRRVKTIDDVPIIVVPRSRFWSEIVMGNPGFIPGIGANGINFILVHQKAVNDILKTDTAILTSLTDSAENAFGSLLKHLLYTDVIIWDNKEPGIYISADETIVPA